MVDATGKGPGWVGWSHHIPGYFFVRVEGNPTGAIELASSTTPGRTGLLSWLSLESDLAEAGGVAGGVGEEIHKAFFPLV